MSTDQGRISDEVEVKLDRPEPKTAERPEATDDKEQTE